MPQLEANGIAIEYDTFGDAGARPLLLVMGLGAQMTRWPEEFCDALAQAGHYVVRFDNRDVGLSKHFDEAGVPDIAAITVSVMSGGKPEVPYTLHDMADDAAGVLDALEIEAAHVCGASLGGMIVQTLALRHPDRVRSLTSIMSSTGNRELPPARPEAMAALMSPPATDREGSVLRTLQISSVIGSPAWPADQEELRARTEADFDRSFYPVGTVRQMAAATVQENRRPLLERVRVPSLVIHGRDDPLVPLSGGIDTHEGLPDSELHVIDGMGHDLPRQVWPSIVGRIQALTLRA